MFRLNSVHVIVIDCNRISYRKMGYGNFAKHVVTAVVCNEAAIAQTNKLKNTTAAQTFGARPSRDLLVHVARVSCIAYCS